MKLVIIGFLGGLITGISPCILPILPVVFLVNTLGKSSTPKGATPPSGRSSSSQPSTSASSEAAAVELNPRVMMVWGLMITALLAAGCLALLVGLVVVMPVLGHASWHLYRKVVAD